MCGIYCVVLLKILKNYGYIDFSEVMSQTIYTCKMTFDGFQYIDVIKKEAVSNTSVSGFKMLIYLFECCVRKQCAHFFICSWADSLYTILNQLAKGRSFQPYMTCQAPFQFIF